MPSTKRRAVRRGNSKQTKLLRDLHKDDSRLLGEIRAHLVTKPRDDDRVWGLHPSELAKPSWCPRAAYLKLSGHPPKEDPPTQVLQGIFSEGKAIHQRWQGLVWDVGKLRGEFSCRSCQKKWCDTAPRQCPQCGVGRSFLKYDEVPLSSEEHLIIGHADGDIAEGHENHDDDPILEIKSIGKGTLRWEAPKLLQRYEVTGMNEEGRLFTVLDLDSLWRDLKKPLRSHRTQVSLYLYCLRRREAIIIYEAKWSQQHKEFIIERDDSLIAPILDQCHTVALALRGETGPPECAHVECAECARYEEHLNDDNDQRRRRRRRQPSQSEEDQEKVREAAGVSGPTIRPATYRTDKPDGVARLRPHGAIRSPDSVGEVLPASAGSSRDRGEERRTSAGASTSALRRRQVERRQRRAD